MQPRPPLSDVRILLATWFGSGYAPAAPGTMGTVAAVPVGVLIAYAFGAEGLLAASVVISFIGVRVADDYMAQSGEHDPGPVVIDEVAGVWIAMLPVADVLTWQGVFAAFVLFRLFDIVKPWPISWADQSLKGGVGVMADDILAGAASLLCVYGLVRWVPDWMGLM